MALEVPYINIIFQQYAASLITRSQRGNAILIIRDDTDKSFSIKKYKDITDLDKDKALYTDENYKYIEDVLTFAPYQLFIVRINKTAEEGQEAPTVSDALNIIVKNIKTGRISIAGGTQEDFNKLSIWEKAQENSAKTYKVLTYKPTTEPDCKHVENLSQDYVTFKDDRGKQTGDKYLPSMLGILSSCNIKRSATCFKCTNLESVEEVEDETQAINKGKLIMHNTADGPEIVLGINSMTTTNGKTATEDMKYIDTVEAMDMILDDIRDAFKEYQGAYKNKLDNQMLLISAINGYFKTIAKDDVLDLEFDNKSYIDVKNQRDAWLAAGKTEAAEWDDEKVRHMTFKRKVFLQANIKILGSMDDLDFIINLE